MKRYDKVDFWEGFGSVHHAPLFSGEVDNVSIYLDRSSIEVFVNEGEVVMTEIIFPSEPYTELKLEGFGGTNTLYYLESIW